MPCEHGSGSILQKILQTDRRRYLGAGGLVGWLQQRVTDSVGDRHLRGDSPGILGIGLEFLRSKMTHRRRSGRQGITVLGDVVVGKRRIE